MSSEITRDGSNEYTARLSLSSNHRTVFSMNILYSNRNDAKKAVKRWHENAEEIFSDIYDRLDEGDE